ncbi:MAG: Hsp20/alpha crystallin family protein, partial [Gammaproteobacteria bacterium]|nr:Hsp20/alpha crystallin family protein [Gammaproteobacteria bacterium]
EIEIRAEIPGVDKKDLEITVTEDALTIKGSTRQENKEEKGNYYRSEISGGIFARTLMLPGSVNADKAKTEFKDGVLKLTLPKVEKAKRRTIRVD